MRNLWTKLCFEKSFSSTIMKRLKNKMKMLGLFFFSEIYFVSVLI